MTKEIVKQAIPEIMEWVVEGGETIQVTLDDMKDIAGNPKITAKEFYMVCQICKPNKLNPFLKDVYPIKYGDAPAQIIVGKSSILKIATRNKNYAGFEAGVIVLDQNKKVVNREGALVYDGEVLVGGWGRVFKKDGSAPAYNEVSLKEYIGKDKQGNVNRQWREKPATMIRKVGLVQPHREAFPEDFNGIYDEAEVGAIERGMESEDQSSKSRIADIFNKKNKEIIEGEAEEVEAKEFEEEKPDVLLNELRIYVKALDFDTTNWLLKAGVNSIEELTDEQKSKCIEMLKPKYESLKSKQNISKE